MQKLSFDQQYWKSVSQHSPMSTEELGRSLALSLAPKRLPPDFTVNKNPVADHVLNQIGSRNLKVFVFICTYKFVA